MHFRCPLWDQFRSEQQRRRAPHGRRCFILKWMVLRWRSQSLGVFSPQKMEGGTLKSRKEWQGRPLVEDGGTRSHPRGGGESRMPFIVQSSTEHCVLCRVSAQLILITLYTVSFWESSSQPFPLSLLVQCLTNKIHI